MTDRDNPLTRALDAESREARYLLLDAFAANVFNVGNDLDGSLAEEGDVRWLAREIWQRMDDMRVSGGYDRLTREEREHWEAVATASLAALEGLMRRIGHRVRSYAAVLGEMERAERKARERR
jgi:hypothetical protein